LKNTEGVLTGSEKFSTLIDLNQLQTGCSDAFSSELMRFEQWKYHRFITIGCRETDVGATWSRSAATAPRAEMTSVTLRA